MAGAAEGFAFRRHGYSGGRPARLWRPCGSLLPLAAALLGLAAGGCSFSYQLGSLLGDDKDQPGRPALAASGPQRMGAIDAPKESDLAHARAAVAEAFAKGGATRSTPWENPTTGARGTVTPIASAYDQEGGFVCRDFLASYVRGGAETWLEGEACRVHKGQWEVRRLSPRKRS